jgi:hypothetical protein
MENDGLFASMSAIIVVRASNRGLGSWGSVSPRARQPTTDEKNLTSLAGAVVDCDLTQLASSAK